jgi:hypothetical protein
MPDKTPAASLADDLLREAGPIAAYIYGADTPENRRKVWFIVSPQNKSRSKAPIFKEGRFLIARKSELDEFYSAKRVKAETAA